MVAYFAAAQVLSVVGWLMEKIDWGLMAAVAAAQNEWVWSLQVEDHDRGCLLVVECDLWLSSSIAG